MRNNLFILTIMILLLISGCDNKAVEVDYSSDIEELNLQLDKNLYLEAFEVFLNEAVIGNKDENINKDIISSQLISEAVIDVEDSLIEDEELPLYEAILDDGDSIETIEYPIFDEKGHIVGYGTKEDYEKSLEIYANTPYYTVDGIEIYDGIIIYKVYDKAQQSYIVFEAKLNSANQIESYSQLRIGG